MKKEENCEIRNSFVMCQYLEYRLKKIKLIETK